MGFFFFDALDLGYALECLVAFHAASDAVNGVGREDDDAVVVEAVKNHLDVARVWVVGVYLQKHIVCIVVFTKNARLFGRALACVIPLGFEPRTHSLEGCCSIQLSYRSSFFATSLPQKAVQS